MKGSEEPKMGIQDLRRPLKGTQKISLMKEAFGK